MSCFVLTTDKCDLPRIGYDNAYLDDGVILAVDNEDPDNPGLNLKYSMPELLWKPGVVGISNFTATFTGPRTVNYFAVFSTNAHTLGATIAFQKFDGGLWTDVVPAYTPTSAAPQYFMLDPEADTAYRVQVNTPSDELYLGVAQFGEEMVLLYGIEPPFTPPTLGFDVQAQNVRSDRGRLLGTISINRGFRDALNLRLLPPEWVRATWKPFQEFAQRGFPFFFVWSPTFYPDEVGFAWAERDSWRNASYDEPTFMAAGVRFSGMLE